MGKCIFDKKANIKGYYRCEITGQIKGCRCNDYRSKYCKYFKANIWHRFMGWLYDKFVG